MDKYMRLLTHEQVVVKLNNYKQDFLMLGLSEEDVNLILYGYPHENGKGGLYGKWVTNHRWLRKELPCDFFDLAKEEVIALFDKEKKEWLKLCWQDKDGNTCGYTEDIIRNIHYGEDGKGGDFALWQKYHNNDKKDNVDFLSFSHNNNTDAFNAFLDEERNKFRCRGMSDDDIELLINDYKYMYNNERKHVTPRRRVYVKDFNDNTIMPRISSQRESVFDYINLKIDLTVALNDLPPRSRRCFLYNKVVGYRIKDVSSNEGISYQKVCKHSKKAGIALRHKLIEYDNTVHLKVREKQTTNIHIEDIEKTMNTATMKNWSVTTNQDGFIAPELVNTILQGDIYEDSAERFVDGDPINTSAIISVTDCGAYKTVATANTNYKVYPNDVDRNYEIALPGAYERLQVMSKE